ncbi:hypothetical protein H6G89_11435 [Oscillatoria sp. FACHB-1407]|nr:hypothetical protein [Oscillatoria sp. FACHB-1407]MBD2461664.1 hypothetical protein [Oscillatoria sp. FACHB-1407]
MLARQLHQGAIANRVSFRTHGSIDLKPQEWVQTASEIERSQPPEVG